LNARFNTESFVDANNALQREILAQRQATRLARWLAGIALLVSLLLGGMLMLLARQRRNSRRQDLVLRTLASNAPDTLLLLDAQGRIEFANRPLFSEPKVPQRGQTLTALVPPSAQLQVDAALNRVIHDGTAVQFDVRLEDSNGALRHFEQSALPILEANRVVGATLRSTDVTQRRRLEERLITQSQVLETMSEGVILLSESHHIDYANRAFVEMIGGSNIDVRSLDLSTLGLDARHLEPAAIRLETTLKCLDGRERRIAIACTRLALHDRNWLICVVQDVTETHRLELEVLNVAIRERDRFSSDVHEGLGQELTGIALLLESLRRMKPEDTATLDERLAEVILHVNRTIQISRDLAHGLSPIQIERGSLGTALIRLAADLSGRLHIPVNCQVDIGGVEVGLTVADYLYRSAREAISNAMRHGGATEINITLASRSEHLVLSVTDNGVGMDPGTVGTGLGLRMILHRARLIGATVQIKPSAGRGTVISIAVLLTRAGE
jgi:PAS domain S-box-containing protein